MELISVSFRMKISQSLCPNHETGIPKLWNLRELTLKWNACFMLCSISLFQGNLGKERADKFISPFIGSFYSHFCYFRQRKQYTCFSKGNKNMKGNITNAAFVSKCCQDANIKHQNIVVWFVMVVFLFVFVGFFLICFCFVLFYFSVCFHRKYLYKK